MASSGRGGLRLNQPPRAPTLIAVGLTVAFIALAYNYWAVSIIKRKLSAENTELRDAVAKLKDSRETCAAKLVEVEAAKKTHEISDQKNEQALEDKIREMTDLQTMKEQLQKDLDKEKSTCEENLQKELGESEEKSRQMLSNSQQSWLEEKKALQFSFLDSMNITRQNYTREMTALQEQCAQKAVDLLLHTQGLQKQLDDSNMLLEKLQAKLKTSIQLQLELNNTQNELKQEQFQQLEQEKKVKVLKHRLHSVEHPQQQLKLSETHIESQGFAHHQGQQPLRIEEELGQRKVDLQPEVQRGRRVVRKSADEQLPKNSELLPANQGNIVETLPANQRNIDESAKTAIVRQRITSKDVGSNMQSQPLVQRVIRVKNNNSTFVGKQGIVQDVPASSQPINGWS